MQHLLRRAIDPGNVTSVIRDGVTLWLDDPANRAERVSQVLGTDSSTVTFSLVWRTVCAQRTELLDRILLGPAPVGAFLSAGTR